MNLPWINNPTTKAVAYAESNVNYTINYGSYYYGANYTAVAVKPNPYPASYSLGTYYATQEEAMAACQDDYDTYGNQTPPGVNLLP
jgi:hypothetical protein